MKPWCLVLIGCALLMSSCRRNAANAVLLSGPPQVGALYSLNDGEGGFRAGKVVALEDEVVFLRLFAERWTTRPSRVEAHKVARATALAFSAQNFSSMQPIHLENGEVSPDELEAYETWKQSKRDVF